MKLDRRKHVFVVSYEQDDGRFNKAEIEAESGPDALVAFCDQYKIPINTQTMSRFAVSWKEFPEVERTGNRNGIGSVAKSIVRKQGQKSAAKQCMRE